MERINADIRRLRDCALSDAVAAWNAGFKGYFVDMTLSVEGFVARLHNEGISPELSLLAFIDDRAAGFLLNSIRVNAGVKTAWNGGTGVAPEYRGRGLGKLLVAAALAVYHEHDTYRATLEALANNTAAIKLYQQFGYEVVERLIFLEHAGVVGDELQCTSTAYHSESVMPYNVGQLGFYRSSVAWQCQWQSLVRNNGEALIVLENGMPVGYALYRRRSDEAGRLSGISLHQCEARPDHKDRSGIVTVALQNAFAPLDVSCRRLTHNLRQTNTLVSQTLERAGFTTFVEQVQMEKN